MIGHARAEKWATKVNKYGDAIFPLTGAFVVLFLVVWFNDPVAIQGVGIVLVVSSPLWLPIFLFRYLWITWINYIRYLFHFTQPYVLLEIQLPPEVEKSPLAMEIFLSSLWITVGEATFYHRAWLGSYRPVHSLEIASMEGRVHFYLYLRKSLKNSVEARLYGQYPEVKVTEVPDYTQQVPFTLDEYVLVGSEFKKAPNKPQALPIKTYVDFGLDKNPDTPEIQTDPITNLLEHLGTAGPGEYQWFQIIIKGRKKDEWYGIYTKPDKYVGPAQAYIREIMAGAANRAQQVLKESDVVEGKMNALLTDEEKHKVEAIERSLNKNVFECGMRMMYIARKDKMDGSKFLGLLTSFNALRGPEYNQFAPARGHTIFDFPWQDFHNIRRNSISRKLWFRYRHRAYFYPPFDQSPIFLTVEELATLWHFPSSAVKTPSIDRVPSRRAEAPTNLPTLPS